MQFIPGTFHLNKISQMKSNITYPRAFMLKTNNVSNISIRHNCLLSSWSYNYYNNYDLGYKHKIIQSTFFPQIHTSSDQNYSLEDITQSS